MAGNNENLLLEYHKIISNASDIQEKNPADQSRLNEIQAVMDQSNELFAKVQGTELALLDAKVMNISAQVIRENAQCFEANLTAYNPKHFAECILKYVTDDSTGERHWDRLYPFAEKCFEYKPPSLISAIGMIQPDENPVPSRKIQRKRDIVANTKKKEPEALLSVEKEEDGVEESVNYINKLLKTTWKKNGGKPIFFYRLVLNPDSFAISVQNIFHLSFLCKDGRIELRYDGDCPMIYRVPRETVKHLRKLKSNAEVEKTIVSMTYDDWRRWIEEYNIEEPMIKPKATVQNRPC